MHRRTDLELAIALAREAGAAIEAVRRSGFSVSDKADASPVTEADQAADRLIRAGLEGERPDDALLSEEHIATPARPDQSLWCVDPLDGTEAFIGGARGYAVQIAQLLPSPAGHYTLALAVVYEPAFDELFYATRGGGTFAVLGGKSTGPLTVSPRKRSDGLGLVTSTRIRPGLRDGLFTRGYTDGGALRSVGVKVGRLVLGQADVYLATHGLSWWDLAAPQLILEEAGGRVTTFTGEAPVYALPTPVPPEIAGPLVLTNGHDHDAVIGDLAALYRPARSSGR